MAAAESERYAVDVRLRARLRHAAEEERAAAAAATVVETRATIRTHADAWRVIAKMNAIGPALR